MTLFNNFFWERIKKFRREKMEKDGYLVIKIKKDQLTEELKEAVREVAEETLNEIDIVEAAADIIAEKFKPLVKKEMAKEIGHIKNTVREALEIIAEQTGNKKCKTLANQL